MIIRLLFLVPLGLAASSALAATKVERDGDKITYREELSSEHIAQASDRIRAYVMNGTFENVKGMTCEHLYELFHEAAVADGMPGHLDLIGVAECSRKKTDPIEYFDYTFTVEARTEADVPLVEKFVAERKGKPVLGRKLEYKRAYGVLLKALVDFYDEAVLDDPGDIFDTFEKQKLFMNWRQTESWVMTTTKLIEAPDSKKLLDWIGQETDQTTVRYYRDTVLPVTKLIKGSAEISYILEDRTVVRAPLDENMGYKDSHDMKREKSI